MEGMLRALASHKSAEPRENTILSEIARQHLAQTDRRTSIMQCATSPIIPHDYLCFWFASLRPCPEISSTKLYLRQALASEPPKRPTPMTAIFLNSFMIVSIPAQDRSPEPEIIKSVYQEFSKHAL